MVCKLLENWWGRAKQLFSPPKTRQAIRRRRIRYALISIVAVIALFSYVTNPFVRFSIVLDPYKDVQFVEDSFELEPSGEILLRDRMWSRQLAFIKSGWHIVSSKFVGGPKAKNAEVDEIIREIHAKRFDPAEPYLISGDHFSVLYPRSLGIFYHTLLDPRTALDDQDWRNRQSIYLKTTAYALQVFNQSNRLSTTIVPIGPRSVALMNIYAPPSDTLYSLLYALDVMQSEESLREIYPFETPKGDTFSLQTATAAAQLLEQYKPSLRRYWETYLDQAYDAESGFLRRDLALSGAKDIVKRESAFYDNVIFWRTTQLAQELGLISPEEFDLDAYRRRILHAYWLPEEGYFLEDQSNKGRENKHYSSDWLIAFQTGFLNPRDPADQPYLIESVEYIQRNALDQPFGLQFQADRRDYQLYGLVRWLAPEYGSTAIWSNWGMEYIKLLTLLAQTTGDSLYLEQAERQLAAYTYNIKRYRGYPEVYDQNGDFFRKMFYKSIRQTGWVVTYEQARALHDWTRQNWASPTTSR